MDALGQILRFGGGVGALLERFGCMVTVHFSVFLLIFLGVLTLCARFTKEEKRIKCSFLLMPEGLQTTVNFRFYFMPLPQC